MIPVPPGVRVYLSTGVTDMRRGMPGLSLQVKEALEHIGPISDLTIDPSFAPPNRKSRSPSERRAVNTQRAKPDVAKKLEANL